MNNAFEFVHKQFPLTLGEYARVTRGFKCERITSKSECEEAARQLDLSDTSASEETEWDYPPYCYLHRGSSSLWFNDQGRSDTFCDSDNICICKVVAGGVGGVVVGRKLRTSSQVTYQN